MKRLEEMRLSLLTIQGFVVKNLIDIFCQNFKDEICLEFAEDGVHCEQITTNGARMLQFVLLAHTLEEYSIDAPFLIGLQLRQLLNIFKSIKKRDVLRLQIEPDTKHLTVIITVHEQRRQITSTIPFYDIQQIKSEPIAPYKQFVALSTQEFTKLIKEINILNNEIHLQIYPEERSFKFTSRSCDITEKVITIGTPGETPAFTQTYPHDFLNHMCKVNYITQQVKFNFAPNMPLQISCNINDMGYLVYYIHAV